MQVKSKQASMVESDKHDKTSSSVSVREQGNIALQCPKLSETNYTTWALMMETILKAYGLWKVIDETDGKKETSGTQETAIDEKAENTTKGIIFQTLPQDMLMQVALYTTAKEEVWNSIKVKHIGANLVQKARLQTLRSELETLKMKPNESANEFAGKLSSIQAKFKSLWGTLKDKVLVRKLFNSAPKKFLPIVASIEQYQEIDTMQFEEDVGRITAFEERLKSQDEPEYNYQNKLLLARAADIVKDHKRKHDDDDDEDPSAGSNQDKITNRIRSKESELSKKPPTTKETPKGRAPSKGFKTGKTATTGEPIEEPIVVVVMDDPMNTAAEDVGFDADQPYDDSTQAKDKVPKQCNL
nr:zinc finger, CCHC-type [Tanacetum cinerariifolium]